MATPDHTAMQVVDLDKYSGHIESIDDITLLQEATKAAKAGALRAAYIMVWIACAESLKRRFREAQPRDNEAGKIVGEFESMEQQHSAVDKFLLTKALEYGFVSDSGYAHLLQIYENRCIYGHPYEEAPSPEKLKDAAATVVELVLSKPVKLRHGFVKRLLEDLLTTGTYLDDQESAVSAYLKQMLPRIDEDIHAWLLDQYLERLEKISGDASTALFFRRGQWFAKAMVAEIGVGVFGPEEWHDRAVKFPKTVMGICSTETVFSQIGTLAQDAVVGAVLEESTTRASALAYLEQLHENDILSLRQSQRFEDRLSNVSFDEVRVSQLGMKLSYPTVIRELSSGNYQAQNTAVNVVNSLGPTQAALLGEREQEILGRTILQAADLNAWSATRFLRDLKDQVGDWPLEMIRGIALESFIDQQGHVRLNITHLQVVASALDQLDSTSLGELVNGVLESIKASTVNFPTGQEQLDTAVQVLNRYPWSEKLVQLLQDKV